MQQYNASLLNNTRHGIYLRTQHARIWHLEEAGPWSVSKNLFVRLGDCGLCSRTNVIEFVAFEDDILSPKLHCRVLGSDGAYRYWVGLVGSLVLDFVYSSRPSFTGQQKDIKAGYASGIWGYISREQLSVEIPSKRRSKVDLI